MKTFLTLTLLGLLFTMVSSQDKNTDSNPFEKLSWIVDRWISPPGESITYENWVKLDDTTFSGESHTIKNGDTVFTE